MKRLVLHEWCELLEEDQTKNDQLGWFWSSSSRLSPPAMQMKTLL
jgi:hypothetical protein